MFVGHIQCKGKASKERSSTESSNYRSFNYSEEAEVESQLSTKLSRTSLLINDYKQFIAARRIQAAWRGFQFRKTSKLHWQAAITIQRWWRGFQVRKGMFNKIEQRLQRTVIEHHSRSATKIQALFRGWWIRQTVHDMHSLKRMQICAAEELINCVAFKLHHLLRTVAIPGVYSLRNSNCLSRVEKLLASMTFRFHNDRVRGLLNKGLTHKEHRRREFQMSKYNTSVPFAGPNFNKNCSRPCEELLKMDKDMDRRMYKIIAEYEKTLIEKPVSKLKHKLKERNQRKYLERIIARQNKHKKSFCGDVIESMRKWKLWDGKQLQIDKNLFRHPDNLENFILEMGDLWDELEQASCHCKVPKSDEVSCH
ncbi:unconventional myosin-Va [Drosophila tropicalis]|uniref:unconventional myosin-Va n=1 Tax=Drosophila tropicalis TaxID=46794 RepID=UPI0035AB89E7